MWASALGQLRGVALAEGVSYVLLLGVAMPLKYVWGEPLAVRILGSVHGGLFVALLLALIRAHRAYGWSVGFVAQIFVASLVPGGAFWMDRRLRKLKG